MKILFFFLIIIFTVFRTPNYYTQIDSVTWKRFEMLGKGINSQGWLTHIFNTNTSGYIEYTEADFQQMSQYGFNHVRLKVDYAHWLDTTTNITDSTILLYTDTAISYCLNNNLITVLDYYNWSWDEVMLNSNNYIQTSQILGEQWKNIAERYKDYPSDSLLYEIYNEPGGVNHTEMRIAFKTIIDSIRTVDTVHTIIVWGQVDDYTLLEDENIILTLHFYEPHFFANQGKTFGNNIFNTTGVPFPYDSLTMPTQSPLDTGAYLLNLYNNYPNKGTVAYVENWIQGLKSHADSLNVPLYMGEFGCTNRSPEEGMMNYIKTIREAFETHNMPWAIFNWKNKNDSFFSIFNCDGCFDTDSLFTDSTNYTILCALGLDSCNNFTSQNDWKLTANQIILFPNPAADYFSLDLNYSNIVEVRLYDISGKLMFMHDYHKGQKIDVSQLQNGLYYIKTIVNKNHFSSKLIKY